MTITSVGDLARGFQLRTQQVQIKTEIDDLSKALSSGRVSDLSLEVRGDFVPIAAIERDLASLASYARAASEAAGFASASQLVVGRVGDTIATLAPELLVAADLNPNGLETTVGREAGNAFEATVSAINTRFAGRSLFSGITVNASPLSDAETMMADLRAAVAGQTTAAGVTAVVNAWFGPGGDFETVHYQGSTTPLAPFHLADGVSVTLSGTASDARLRDVLEGLALGALLTDGPLSGNIAELKALSQDAGQALLSAQSGLQELSAEIGSAEASIEQITVRNRTATAALELARNDIVEADAYETASRLEVLQSQLELLYAVTARTSELSLAAFLR